MEFQTLSHAGMRVRAGGKELLFDPWVVGSVYWRSWWNYPPVPRDLVNDLKPDFIYLTHMHWDHFQAASLRLFPEDVQILIPYDRHGRMVKDLHDVGKTNIRELKHGERIELADGLAMRSFQFGPYVTDSAAVVEAEGRVLLNANDAKFAGGPLEHILSLYPEVDFCFRSHSSANARVCYHYLDAADEQVDDPEHYLRSFYLFMKRVKPRYAIPFASNSCHLHDDTWKYNPLVQTPILVRDYFRKHAAEDGLETDIEIMIPGDTWSEEEGFTLQEHDYFENRDAHLEAYRERVEPTLAKQRALEAKVQVSLSVMKKFFAKVKRECPFPLLRPLKGRKVLVISKSEGRGDNAFAVDMAAGEVEQVPLETAGDYTMRIEFPAIILLQAIKLNMFAQASISKRVQYYAMKADMPVLKKFVQVLDFKEAELWPVRNHFSARTIKSVLPRWRESLLYAGVVLDRARGRSYPEIEEKLLDG